MNAFIFTFGRAHFDARGNSLAGRFVRLAGTFGDTRARLAAVRGSRWAFQYEAAEGAAVVRRHGLQPIDLDDVALPDAGGIIL